ncbi:hypothetical protein [Streptomyces sp. NPDC088246]|uniref:hypothetical protein n=1 Tax=Streptomyces sp. NPDC088246 TaxID=3365842 RepID=UPI003823A4A1
MHIHGGLTAVEAAPLQCAGLTAFMPFIRWPHETAPWRPCGGICGLGHLALQYAHRLGHRVAAIARVPEKEQLAEETGAPERIDSAGQDPAATLGDLVAHRSSPAPAPR